MATLTETFHAGGFLISEARGTLSREAVIVLSGENLLAGTVLGRVTAGAATPAAVAGNSGNGVLGAVTLSAGAKPGVYKLTIIEPGVNVGEFIVEDPDGITIGNGTVAVAFSAGGLAFTLADGSTDFAAGDQFTITVAAGSGKYREMDPANGDGSDVAAGILLGDVNAAAGDRRGAAVVRKAEVNAAELVWFSGATTDQKAAAQAQLARLGIIFR